MRNRIIIVFIFFTQNINYKEKISNLRLEKTDRVHPNKVTKINISNRKN